MLWFTLFMPGNTDGVGEPLDIDLEVPGVRWSLADAEQRHRANPDGFEIPPYSERQTLEPGDFAKLVFELDAEPADGHSGERMWVRITGVPEGWYEGFLDDDPLVITSLENGDPIVFEPRHVADIRHQY